MKQLTDERRWIENVFYIIYHLNWDQLEIRNKTIDIIYSKINAFNMIGHILFVFTTKFF